MNRIYKVIWSKVRNSWVVVSEIARNHGKEHASRKRIPGGVYTLGMALALGLALPSAALAADPVELGNQATAAYDDKGNLTIGNQGTVAEGSKKAGKNNTTIGTDTDTLRNVTENETSKNGQPMDENNKLLVKGEGQANDLAISTEADGATAVGYKNRAEGERSTAIGNQAQITDKPVVYYADADGNKTTSQDDAAWYKDKDGKPTKVPQVFRDADGNTTAMPQYIHTYTEIDPDTKEEVTKKEVTADASLADKNTDGTPVYNYQKSDNLDKLYSVTLYQASNDSIAAGSNVSAQGSKAVAVGYSSSADSSAVAIGDTAIAKENTVAIGKDTKAAVDGAIALGTGSQADRSGGVTGWDPKTGTTSTKSDVAWQSGAGALSIGNGGASRQITNVAAGSEDSDAVNLAQLKEAMTHYYSVKTTADTDAAGNNNYLNDGASGDNALAAGVSAVATGDNATAVGTKTYASGENASAYGYRAAAMGKDSVSIGSGTSAQQEGSVAIGGHAQGYHAVQVGTNSTAQSAYSVAVGGHAKGDHSVEVGYGSTAQGSYSASVGGLASGNYSIAIGSSKNNWGDINPATADGDNSIAIGGHTNSANDIAIGAGSGTSGGHAIAVGGFATSSQAVSIGGVAGSSQATAVGSNSSATGAYSTAVGGHAGDTNSTAVGQGANATYAYATAVGNSSTASGPNSTALGYGTSAQGSNSTAIGGANANGTNLTVIGKGSTASSSSWYGDAISNSTAIGGAHISASDAAAIGSNATVNDKFGVALGHNSNVSYASTGIGAETKASNTGTAVGYGAQSSGYQSAAIGAGSMATGQNAVSLGGGGAWGNYSIALGSGAGTTAHAIALGQNSGAWGENAIAIGEGTNAWRANSIVLGKNSKSGVDKNIAGYDPRTGVASVDDTATWQSTDEAVSIGRAEERDEDGNITASAITRQLNNLAAGTLDTDAVNVAQLKAATQKINMHDYSVNSTDTETDTNYTNGGAIAKNSLAAGVSASTTKNAENAVAIGYKAKADGFGATVIGQYGEATGRYALAFGGQQTDTTAEPANNVASGDNALSFGERTTASGSNATAFGQGTKATEKRATAFGQRTQAIQSNATAFGIDTLASGQNATAFGNLTQATEIGATAFGNKNQATGKYAAAWGGGDKVISNEDGTTMKIGTVASGTYATAFGERTLASGESATAFGSDSTASGKNSVAFGENSTAAAENSLAALGGTVDETAANAAAIGNGAQAKLADSVALGSGALANRSSGSKGYNVLTGDVTTETSAAWVSNASAFAVGNDTEGSLLTRQVTGVAAGSLDTDAVNVAQLKAAGLSFTTNTKDASNTTDKYKGYKVVSRKLGDTIAIKASDEAANHSYSTANLTTRIAENGDISILMDENPAFTSVTTSDVIFAGNPDLTDKDGKAAAADTNATYGTKTLTDSQNITSAGNDTQATRLHYKDAQGHTYEVATMDDGQIYAGDIKEDGTADSTGFARTLNQKTTINGGVTNKDSLTDGNIGVVSNGTDTLTVKLAKELKDLTSVTTGKTVQDDSGIKITNDATDETQNVVINGDKISYGGNQVTNMGSGADGTDAAKKPTYNTLTNGANIGDVKNIANTTVQPVIDTVNKGWELDVNGTKQKAVTPTSPKVNLIQGQNITITGDATNTDNVTIATADDVRFNTVRVGGSKTDTGYTGGIVIGKQSGGDSANPDENDYITGLKNTNWDSNKIQSGRAATEDQLKKVADDIKQGTVAGDVYVTGGEVAYHTDGGSDNGQPTVNDGTGKLTLTENNKTSKIEITGLHDYYVTNGTVADDGKTLELTRNDRDENGNPKKISIDLGNVLKHDLHLVQNPAAGSDGKYKVDTKTGTVTLKVQNGDGTDASDITIGGFEGLGKGLKFGANQKATDTGSNPVTNQLGSTLNVTGEGEKALNQYSGKNLLTSVEQDADGNTTIHVLMDKNISADSVVVGQEGKAGKDGKDGYIGINGKNGADGITTTLIRTEKGQPGADGKNGKPGVDGTDITRIVYQNGQDGTDGKDTHTVATLDDGLKFAGDDGQDDATKVITKKLNERLDIVGKAQGELTDANIGVTKDENGKLYIQLAKHVDLDQDGTLQAGDAKIGHFTNTELSTNKGNHPSAGSYTIGLGNKDWNVDSPEYVSGRAATEDQLAKVSEAITNATTAAGKRTVVTVNDKSDPATADPGANAYGEYDTQNGNLMIAAKRDSDGLMTYNIKLNDKLTLGKDGTDGQEGTIGLTGKDGLPGADGKQGYSTTIIKTEKGQKGEDGKTGKENLAGTDITRIVYTDKDGQNAQTVATLDDGLKFVGNDGQEVTRKLNETLSIKGGITDADTLKNASTKNLGVRQNTAKDGLEIVMTDTPDFTKITVGGDKKITIGGQDNSDTKNPANGNYITGLDNTQWDKDHVTENRAATEGQLSQAINDIKGATNGGFGLADEKGGTVKKDLGQTVKVKGDGKNIETKVNDGALEVSLKKDVDLGKEGILKAGDGVNQVTVDGSRGQVTIGSGNKTLTLGQQANTAGDSNPATGNFLNGLDNRKWDGEPIQSGRAATEDQLKTVSDKVNSGRKFQGDDGKEVKVDMGETLNLKGGAQEVSSADNIGIVKGDDNTLNVRLAKDIAGLDSVTTGNTTINNSGLTVKTGDANRTITVQDGNVNMGGNQIHNVAPGTAPTDAVNVSQLQQTGRAINQLGSSLDKLGTRVDRVGANSAALAALHPLDFDPDDKLDFAVGAGNYSGANAVALGAFYRPNEDVMFSLGGSTGGGENMINVGATFKIGQHNHVSNSRVAMAKEIRDLKALVARQDGEMQQLKTLMNQMAGKTVMAVDKDALFPDIPENHWAYDYVTKLARAGIVEGYEDGEFKGNRMMTRYEFAAVIYRAIMAGAGSNPALDQDGTLGKLVKEFDGELKYIRIDVIEKDKHGKPTIERVRTVEDSKKHHGK